MPKWLPVNEVVESLYKMPMISIASVGYPRSSMRASSRAWSIESNAFLKSIYVMYMSLFVSIASSRDAKIIWICREVFLWGQNLSWLKCSNMYCSP